MRRLSGTSIPFAQANQVRITDLAGKCRHIAEAPIIVARVAQLGPLAHAGTVAQAIAFGDALFIAVPYAALPQIGNDYRAALKGKIMLDACNAVPTRDGAAITKEADD